MWSTDGKDSENRAKPPDDVILIASFASYDVFLSKSESCIYVYPSEYRVGTLRLSKDTLKKLIELME